MFLPFQCTCVSKRSTLILALVWTCRASNDHLTGTSSEFTPTRGAQPQLLVPPPPSPSPPLTFATQMWSGSLRPGTFTIEQLRPVVSSPLSANFSFVPSSLHPLDRTSVGHHHFGDVTLRFTATSSRSGAGREENASIHCAPPTASCVVATDKTASADECASRCEVDAECAAWSWGRPPLATCFLLSNQTAAPVADPNAVCGWKSTWRPVDGYATDVSTADVQSGDVTTLPCGPNEISAVSIALAGMRGVELTRRIAADPVNGNIVLVFTLLNHRNTSVELSGFGLSVVTDSIFTGRTLVEIGTEASFTDPALLGQHGYAQVVSTTGRGPVLLVLPSNETKCEAWRMIREDPTPRSVTFEGFYSMMAHSKGWADVEWKDSGGQFNPPTSHVIGANETYALTYRLTLADNLVGGVDDTLHAAGRAVFTAVPGFVLTPEMLNASLVIRTPHRVNVTSVDVTVTTPGNQNGTTWPSLVLGTPTPRGQSPGADDVIVAVMVNSSFKGDATGDGVHHRVSVTLSDGTVAFVHFFVMPESARARVRRYASALVTRYHFNDTSDPFMRAPSFMNVDARETTGVITQNNLAFIAGLSDEAGAGPGVGMACKSMFDPEPSEVALLAAYVEGPLWGTAGARASASTIQQSDYGVRASMFYSGNPRFNYTCHPCWDLPRSLTTWRSYNYPHVTTVYWALYRLAREYGSTSALPLPRTWQWYLGQAVNTTLLGARAHGTYNQYGLMVGSVWSLLLDDVQHEAALDPSAPWADVTVEITEFEQTRAAAWAQEPFPFGSEMPWDSTGQEEVWTWTRRFGLKNASDATLRAVLAYMPRVANWAYRGNARRYFDFGVWSGAEFVGTEREFHHYGAPLNAIVALGAFRASPDETHLLDVGLAGATGTLTNIRGTGVASMAWHGDPASLSRDPFDFDFGIGFFGHSTNSGSFLVNRTAAGPPYDCYMCNAFPSQMSPIRSTETRSSTGTMDVVHTDAGPITIVPVDSFGRRVYLGPIGLELIARSGRFHEVVFDYSARTATATVVHHAVLPLVNRVELSTPAAPGTRPLLHLECPGATLNTSVARTECSWQSGNLTTLTVTWSVL